MSRGANLCSLQWQAAAEAETEADCRPRTVLAGNPAVPRHSSSSLSIRTPIARHSSTTNSRSSSTRPNMLPHHRRWLRDLRLVGPVVIPVPGWTDPCHPVCRTVALREAPDRAALAREAPAGALTRHNRFHLLPPRRPGQSAVACV